MEAFTYISTKIYPASAEVLPSYRHADKTFKTFELILIYVLPPDKCNKELVDPETERNHVDQEI